MELLVKYGVICFLEGKQSETSKIELPDTEPVVNQIMNLLSESLIEVI